MTGSNAALPAPWEVPVPVCEEVWRTIWLATRRSLLRFACQERTVGSQRPCVYVYACVCTVWLDVSDSSAPVPSFNGSILLKVSRISLGAAEAQAHRSQGGATTQATSAEDPALLRMDSIDAPVHFHSRKLRCSRCSALHAVSLTCSDLLQNRPTLPTLRSRTC